MSDEELRARVAALEAAIARHHAQKADDRCQFDDDELYAAAGLPPVDRRVGDKAAMLVNCARFIERRCEGGGPWKSYAELEAENERLRKAIGVCVPSIIRCFIRQTDSDDDRELATKVLARVETAIGVPLTTAAELLAPPASVEAPRPVRPALEDIFPRVARFAPPGTTSA